MPLLCNCAWAVQVSIPVKGPKIFEAGMALRIFDFSASLFRVVGFRDQGAVAYLCNANPLRGVAFHDSSGVGRGEGTCKSSVHA